jgi:hypothetical protein
MAVDRQVEHVIKKQDGTIGEKNTYPRSRDQHPPKGWRAAHRQAPRRLRRRDACRSPS